MYTLSFFENVDTHNFVFLSNLERNKGALSNSEQIYIFFKVRF